MSVTPETRSTPYVLIELNVYIFIRVILCYCKFEVK